MYKQGSLWISICEGATHGLTLVARVKTYSVYSSLPYLQPLWRALVLGQLYLQQRTFIEGTVQPITASFKAQQQPTYSERVCSCMLSTYSVHGQCLPM